MSWTGSSSLDLDEFRPGLRACQEEGVSHPLAEAGMTKEDVRESARRSGLGFWDEPSAACLASRIPYGEAVTTRNLARIEQAEDHLHDLGFDQVRVRTHGTIARIEGYFHVISKGPFPSARRSFPCSGTSGMTMSPSTSRGFGAGAWISMSGDRLSFPQSGLAPGCRTQAPGDRPCSG